ncbi:MAG: DHH family phosphoesterase [Phycisphaerales bacterium]|nr:DHH family phosphoesterase [Phycisphaerales bacterium]
MKYDSTSSAAEIAATLRRARSAVVLTHAKPDGDAVGSTLALARALSLCRIDVEVWYIGPNPKWLDELAGSTPRREFAPMKPTTPGDGRPWTAPSPDVVAIVDTGSWQQVAEMRSWLEGRAASAVIIDHHTHGDAEIAAHRLVKTGAASCTEVLAPVCCALLNKGSPATLPREIAEPLFLGLATDTGWFRFNSVNPGTLRLAADLIEAGVDHTRLYRLIEQQDTISRWRLLGRALSSVQLFDIGSESGKLAISRLTLRDFDECEADRNDTGGFADMVLSVAEVGASAILTEADVAPGEAPLTKISIRSKPGPAALDAGTLTKKLGGGGHYHAAGAKVRLSLDDAQKQLLNAAR